MSANDLQVLDGEPTTSSLRLESLETLPYCDHDVLLETVANPEILDPLVPGEGAHSPPSSSRVPTVRLDDLVQTQALLPTALGLPPDAFRKPRPRSELEEQLIRLFDVVVASVSLVLATPILVLVALAVVADSGGPVLYGSDRIGSAKPVFRAWKFRSMRVHADQELDQLLDNDPEARREYETYLKLRNDPRLTRVGGFIRRTSVDELPQLWNVIRGDMSIVGPRPKLSVDALWYGPALDTVLSVRPGLTGLWQVSGRNNLSLHERVLLDVHYVHHRTFRHDLWICFRTAVILCRPGRHGAY